MPRNIIFIILFTSAGWLFSSCSEDYAPLPTSPENNLAGGSSSAAIGLLGGSVSYGIAALYIPGGALTAQTTVSLAVPADEPAPTLPPDVMRIGDIYQAAPENLDLPVDASISFHYTGALPGTCDESTLTIWLLDSESGDLTELENITVDAAHQVVAGAAASLGYYILTVSTEGVYTTPPPAPELIAPYDGQTGLAQNVVFCWYPESNAVSFQLQVAGDPGFSAIFFDDTGLSGHVHGVTRLDQNTTCYWRVRPCNPAGWGDWSAPSSFTTGSGEPVECLQGVWQLDHTFGYMDDWTDSQNWRIEGNGNLLLIIGSDQLIFEGTQHFVDTFYPHEIVTYYTESYQEIGSYDIADSLLSVTFESTLQPAFFDTAIDFYFEIQQNSLCLRHYVSEGYRWGSFWQYYARL